LSREGGETGRIGKTEKEKTVYINTLLALRTNSGEGVILAIIYLSNLRKGLI